MPTWLKIFEGEPYPYAQGRTYRNSSGIIRRRKAVCSFCRRPKPNLQPIDVVRQGKTPRQTKFYQLCCLDCWKNLDLVVYNP